MDIILKKKSPHLLDTNAWINAYVRTRDGIRYLAWMVWE